MQRKDSLLWYLGPPSPRSDPARSCRALSLAPYGIVEPKARMPVLHSDLFPEFPCDSELIPVEALSTERVQLLWCSGCGTEFTYAPNCDWIMVVYPGMKSDLEM